MNNAIAKRLIAGKRAKWGFGVFFHACLAAAYLYILLGTDIMRGSLIKWSLFDVLALLQILLPIALFALALGIVSMVFLRELYSIGLYIALGAVLAQSIVFYGWLGQNDYFAGQPWVFVVSIAIGVNTLFAIPGCILLFMSKGGESLPALKERLTIQDIEIRNAIYAVNNAKTESNGIVFKIKKAEASVFNSTKAQELIKEASVMANKSAHLMEEALALASNAKAEKSLKKATETSIRMSELARQLIGEAFAARELFDLAVSEEGDLELIQSYAIESRNWAKNTLASGGNYTEEAGKAVVKSARAKDLANKAVIAAKKATEAAEEIIKYASEVAAITTAQEGQTKASQIKTLINASIEKEKEAKDLAVQAIKEEEDFCRLQKEADEAATKAKNEVDSAIAAIKEAEEIIKPHLKARETLDKAVKAIEAASMEMRSIEKWIEAINVSSASAQEAQTEVNKIKNSGNTINKELYQARDKVAIAIREAEKEEAKLREEEELISKASSGEPQAEYNLSAWYFKENKADQAVKWLTKAANGGLLAAQLQLSDMYMNGKAPIDKNARIGAEWLEKAAGQGDVKSQYDLGLYFEDQKNIPDACKWFEKAAEQDHEDSQFKIGFYYRWGDTDFETNVEKGEYWLKKAAGKGNKNAQFHLGNYYRENGDFANAAIWFEKAAIQREKRSMFRFALLNETKAFPGANINTAVSYYTKLAQGIISGIDENNTDAMINLGVLYCEGDAIKADPAKGKALIEKALSYWNSVNDKIEIQPYDCFRVGALFCSGEVNKNNQPSYEDLRTGINLLDVAIRDGLKAFSPETIKLAKDIRDNAKAQIDSLNVRNKAIKQTNNRQGANLTNKGDEKVENYENKTDQEVRDLAKIEDKDAMYEMAFRLKLMPSSGKYDPVENCAWQDYWFEKAADAGHVEAKGRFARSLINRVFDIDDRNKAIRYLESLVKDFNAGKFTGNKDYEEEGIIAKLWLGILLCQGFGMGNRRDPIRGTQLIKDADTATNGFDGYGYRVMSTLAEVFGQGCTKKGGEPSVDDLRQAIAYQKKAIARFKPESDDPNNRGYLELAKGYLDGMEQMKIGKESQKDSFSALGLKISDINPTFIKWQNDMTQVSPVAQQRKDADKAALARLKQRLARDAVMKQNGW